MIRLGWPTREPIINCPAGSSKTHASTQALESSVFIYSYEGIRRYYGKPYQTAGEQSGEPGAQIGSKGRRFAGHCNMVELFYVRPKPHHRVKLDSDVLLQYRFHG